MQIKDIQQFPEQTDYLHTVVLVTFEKQEDEKFPRGLYGLILRDDKDTQIQIILLEELFLPILSTECIDINYNVPGVNQMTIKQFIKRYN